MIQIGSCAIFKTASRGRISSARSVTTPDSDGPGATRPRRTTRGNRRDTALPDGQYVTGFTLTGLSRRGRATARSGGVHLTAAISLDAIPLGIDGEGSVVVG